MSIFGNKDIVYSICKFIKESADYRIYCLINKTFYNVCNNYFRKQIYDKCFKYIIATYSLDYDYYPAKIEYNPSLYEFSSKKEAIETFIDFKPLLDPPYDDPFSIDDVDFAILYKQWVHSTNSVSDSLQFLNLHQYPVDRDDFLSIHPFCELICGKRMGEIQELYKTRGSSHVLEIPATDWRVKYTVNNKPVHTENQKIVFFGVRRRSSVQLSSNVFAELYSGCKKLRSKEEDDISIHGVSTDILSRPHLIYGRNNIPFDEEDSRQGFNYPYISWCSTSFKTNCPKSEFKTIDDFLAENY